MRHFLFVGFLLMIFVALSGCLTDKGELVEDVPQGFCDSLNVTYVGNMKTIIDQNCAKSGCHVNAFPFGDFTSYQSMQNFGSLSASKVGSQVSSETMPLGSSLPDSVKVLFQCWAEAGFPQQ
ncbi:MAG: hypothetical protein JKX84_08520 [Flavobacteriales bacterium]|nr:hypothetical protein [Flavobacteriales bacterium]